MLAWTSFMTGTNPGKHGIYNIQLQTPGTYEQRIPNHNRIKDKTIFRILSENDKKVVSINIPMTYPPPEVNGIVISSWLTPPMASYTYPKNIQKNLQEVGYKIQPSILHKTETGFEKETQDTTEKRFQAAKWIMNNFEWDFMSLLITGTEHMHHNYAAFFDKEHPDYSEGQEDIIRNYYEFVDSQIGELIEFLEKKYGNRVNLIIISDHGFGPSYGKIYLNKVLEKHGFFKSKKTSKNIKTLFEWLERSGVANKLRNILGIGFFDHLPKFIKDSIEKGRSSDIDADWKKTMAYCSSILGDIRINLKGREPDGIVDEAHYDEIRESISSAVKNDNNIGKFVNDIHKREDIYDGPELKNIPDMFVDFNKCCTSSPKVSEKGYIGNRTDAGFHTMEGMIIASGPDIKKNKRIRKAELIDIAPTSLKLLNIEPDKNIDGKVLDIIK